MLTLDDILDASCASPENFEDYQEFHEKELAKSHTDPDRARLEYTGYMRYVIDTHCIKFVIVARRRKNGTYHIKDFIQVDISR